MIRPRHDRFRLTTIATLLLALGFPIGALAEDAPGDDSGLAVKVMAYNVFHGLRTEGKWKFPGEDEGRKDVRFDWQIEQIKEIAPDILLLQEVNPNPKESRKYAEALGLTEIHKVTNCGIHFIVKIPRNMNEGLTILARPELNLKQVGKKKLSGPGNCSGSFGFQTKESRYALFGEITFGDRRILLANTHLHNATYVEPDFEEQLDRLVAEEVLAEEQRDEIMGNLTRRRERQISEVRRLLEAINEFQSGEYDHVILGGDFNSLPSSPVIAEVNKAGFHSATAEGDPNSFLTWDPVGNSVNQGIGSKSKPPLPTFDIPEVEELLVPRKTTPRQIDHVFAGKGLVASGTKMVLEKSRDGLIGSDHYAIVTEYVLAESGR